MDEELERRVMKRRYSGPEHKKMLAHAQKAFAMIIQKTNQMTDAKWPAGQERQGLKCKLWTRLGYMLYKP